MHSYMLYANQMDPNLNYAMSSRRPSGPSPYPVPYPPPTSSIDSRNNKNPQQQQAGNHMMMNHQPPPNSFYDPRYAMPHMMKYPPQENPNIGEPSSNKANDNSNSLGKDRSPSPHMGSSQNKIEHPQGYHPYWMQPHNPYMNMMHPMMGRGG